MAKQYPALTRDHIDLIGLQHIFFVATASSDPDDYINCSPKGLNTFAVVTPSTVAWLNVTGSGNETAAHVLDNGRMTIMFASFDERSIILRLYGHAVVHHAGEAGFEEHIGLFPPTPGARQIFVLTIEKVQTSCGMSMPYYTFAGDRPLLNAWAERQGSGIKRYWHQRNAKTINDKPTHIETHIP